MGRPLARAASLVVASALALAACDLARPPRDPTRPAELHVLMINGGGTPAQNYQSHLLHLRHLLALLDAAGMPRSRVSVLAADGEDPGRDLAMREMQPEPEFWMLRGTPLERPLRTPVTFESSVLSGVTLAPATEEGVEKWFTRARRRVGPGDTLLLYVTDHGTRDEADQEENAITLWKGDALSVRELRALVAELDPGVRVVMVMSQCFSGAFANLAFPEDGLPTGQACGYFAVPADRLAYGCYPENRGRENVGHSFELFQGLTPSGSLAEAHRATLVADRTPDVPLTTSDVFLDWLLEQAAERDGVSTAVLVDHLLTEAWRDKARWEPDIRLLDRIGQAFGLFSPRSLAELEEQAHLLPATNRTLGTYGQAWKAALTDVRRENFSRFLERSKGWKKRVRPKAVRALDAEARRALTTSLLEDLVAFTRRRPGAHDRLVLLRHKAQTAYQAAYRMEVRLGVILRLRILLTQVAGRQYLHSRGTGAERAAYDALIACEDLRLGAPPLTVAGAAPRPERPPFPSYDDDRALAERVLPGWMGVQYRPARKMGSGPARVMTVYPESPAATAGIETGDLVLGPPDAPFTEPGQIREWTMLSPIGKPAALTILRDGRRRNVTLVPKAFPLEWPKLPGPPPVGSAAPPLEVSAHRGKLPERLAGTGSHLLFFWATWCLPCKAALPEVLAFEAATGTPVIAITDEPSERLVQFFARFADPFPETVAVDELRRAFVAYGVSGTPTFVLVDDEGTVRHHATGYTPEKGLPIAGWEWARP